MRARDPRLWLALGAVALLIGAYVAGLGGLLSIEALTQQRVALAAFVASHRAVAMAGFVAAYAALVSLAVPGAFVLTLAGGFLFGTVFGTALVVIGATLGAAVVFGYARRLFGADALERLGPTAARVAAAIRRDAAPYLLAVRLTPIVPFAIVNLVPALVGVRFRTFLWTTAIGILPGTAVFALAGAGLGRVLDAGETVSLRTILKPEIVAGMAGLALLSLAAIPLRRRFGGAA